jgi:hypothetical protein
MTSAATRANRHRELHRHPPRDDVFEGFSEDGVGGDEGGGDAEQTSAEGVPPA